MDIILTYVFLSLVRWSAISIYPRAVVKVIVMEVMFLRNCSYKTLKQLQRKSFDKQISYHILFVILEDILWLLQFRLKSCYGFNLTYNGTLDDMNTIQLWVLFSFNIKWSLALLALLVELVTNTSCLPNPTV